MKIFNHILCSALAACVIAPSSVANAEENEPTYMRSSIYTILVKSDKQNDRIDEESQQADNELMGIIKDLAKTEAKRADADTLFADVPLSRIPQIGFVQIPIPNQFNDHNLGTRVLDFDPLREGITEEEAKAANPQTKNQKFGKFAKGFAGGLMGGASGKTESSMLRVDEVDEYMPAVVQKYFKQNNVADSIVARWFMENPATDTVWTTGIVFERGIQNASAETLEKAAVDENFRATLGGTGYNLIDNTYVVAINLRFRSNKAVAAEATELASAAGSMFGYGGLVKSVGGAAAQAAAGEGFQVQAVTHLYKLDWDDETSNFIAENVIFKNGTGISDLIASGKCHLTLLGKEKAGCNVRQSALSSKPMSDLVMRATVRAIDAAIAKLQEKNEVFRTIVPIHHCDDKGFVYAKIGLKEGLKKGDKYEILEKNIDPETGRITYKAIGDATVTGDQIWNNLYDAEAEAEENAANAKAAESSEGTVEAIAYGSSKFKAGKKDDLSGYLLRLKKKK